MLVGLTLIPCFPRSITAGATVVRHGPIVPVVTDHGATGSSRSGRSRRRCEEKHLLFAGTRRV
jgi:hypothetical protein